MPRSRFLTFSLLLILAACAGQDQPGRPSNSVSSDVSAWSGDLPIQGPWLRERLPDGVMAYARIPHPLGVLSIPKGNMLDQALGSEANIANLINIQQGLARLLTESVGPEAGRVMQLLLDDLRSPVEVAAAALPSPWIMLGLTLNIRSNAELESLLSQISQTGPLPPLLAPLDADGYAQFRLDQAIYLHFDSASGRLALFGGLSANRETFESLLDAPPRNGEHPMRALEAQIDSSGYGYFAWVDTELALGVAPLFLPPDMQQLIRSTNADQIRALALGAGVANGKGRMKLIADVGTDRARRPWPVVDNRISATSVGDPRGFFVLSIPSPEEFARLETLALSALPQLTAQWSDAKTALKERFGVSIEQVLSAIGPELISFSDAAGDFLGMKVRDPALLAEVLDSLAASAGVPIEERNVAGQTIRHVSLPGNLGLSKQVESGEAAPVLGIIGRMHSRMYWIEDGDYLYMAGLPQILIDRARMGPATSIARWLRETQRVDVSSSLLAATGTVPNLPRLSYQLYVSMMQALADLADVSYDVWSMPTPAELGLPERGSLGFSVNLGEPLVSLEMSYESHPGEILFTGGGIASVAAAGVLAAVAIPAYQDYTIRGQVAEGLNLAAAAKTAVVAAFLTNGEVPADLAAAGFDPQSVPMSGRYVQAIEVDHGQIVIRYGLQAHPLLRGQLVVLTPYSDNGAVLWICGNALLPPTAEPLGGIDAGPTSVDNTYLPANCRSGFAPRLAVPAGIPIAAAH